MSLEKWANYLKNMPPPPRLAPLLNPKIDALIHPLAEKNKTLYIADALVHTIVEQCDSLIMSLYKASKYNLTKMLEGEKSG